jgi:hypothetical protein
VELTVSAGMAVRSAFALGLHKMREFPQIFSPEQFNLRRDIWRSIFLLDKFIATSLGRPPAIPEGEYTEASLDAPKPESDHSYSLLSMVSSASLELNVKTSQSFGRVLKKVYTRRKISTRLVQDIAQEFYRRTRTQRPDLDPRRLLEGCLPPAHCIAVLHIHLFRCHAMILLTRPLFLYLFTKKVRENSTGAGPHRRATSKAEKSGEACMAASCFTIRLVHAAHQLKCLPQRNPFAL